MTGRLIHINFNELIFKLLCWYAFFIPLEKILEVFFDIETIFKPYRVLALIIIATFGVKCFYKWNGNGELKRDLFLYLIFAYGLVISAFKMITTHFKAGLFYNDLFQMSLYLAIFVVMRHTALSMKKLLTISKYLGAGIMLNALYIFNNFFILRNFRREAGFMDNPNYLAFSVVVFILLGISLKPLIKSTFKKVAWWVLILFMGYILLISGSRTGILLLVLATIAVLILSPSANRRSIIGLVVLITVLLAAKNTLFPNTLGPLVALNRIQKKATSEDPRIPVWLGIIKASQETNFVGLGIGQFKANFHKFFYDENNSLIKRMLSRGYFLSPHSDYFALLIIYGIFGLICYLIFLFLTGRELLYHHARAPTDEENVYFRYSISIFLALVIFGLAAENFNSPIYWLVLSVSTKTNFSQT